MRLATVLIILLVASAVRAEDLVLAVASNFRVPAEAIVARFTAATGHDVRLSSASTGKLYAQIINGAPFDVLLAADSERPRLLEESGLGAHGTRQTYAIGGLVLWSRDPANAGSDCRSRLDRPGRGRLAIANPATAPYGLAARQFLVNAGIWDDVEARLVYGENIAQALHFVASGNASLGLIAMAQAQDQRLPAATCTWPVPANMHDPVEQQAIVISADNPAAIAFMEFLASPEARTLVAEAGYEVD